MLVCSYRCGQLSYFRARPSLGQASIVERMDNFDCTLPAFRNVHIRNHEKDRKRYQIVSNTIITSAIIAAQNKKNKGATQMMSHLYFFLALQ